MASTQVCLGKSQIGILGGTFNPVHRAHIMMATQALAEYQLDRVLLIPTGQPPHKDGEQIASAKHRLAMLECAVQDHPGLYVSPMEIQRRGTTYTVDTLYQLQAQHPAVYSFIIGADTLCDLPNWKEIATVCKMCRFIAFYRDGMDLGKTNLAKEYMEQTYGAKISVSPSKIPHISSTHIRQQILCGGSVREYVPARVERYLKEHEVYHGQ
ncbi:MAG: nicotinate-nucleotide adenylyltransferase [Christensenellales bacterium]